MGLSKKTFASYIKEFKFPELFNELGWNKDKTNQPIIIDTATFTLRGIAEKQGFKILLCSPDERGSIPGYPIRKKIETKITKLFQEHLIIFVDSESTEQIWQVVVRELRKPVKISETRYHISQEPELLFQRASGIFFELDEEDNITIVDVTQRITENFQQNNERITKQFYEQFRKEHSSFLKFIKGIQDKVNREWYASLMLNRLMFCYFIQRKGFLDKKRDYLRQKLESFKDQKDPGNFYSFYKSFLQVLFHSGLGGADHNDKVRKDIGTVPYLNGGLFEEHEIERSNPDIDIDDKAFERIFDFFDKWEWHLDTRHIASGNDINPDVIGYIFEQYINDRAEMGAYYTKEDITNYITKNCILQYVLEETKRIYPEAFAGDGEIWGAVRNSGDLYIYPSIKKGAKFPPSEIEQDTNNVSQRNEWEKQAPANIALPTETWRTLIERRKRYSELERKISRGDIQSIAAFTTENLNIAEFAQDLIKSTNDPDLLKAFYKALTNVTIIDPTCGSGAFLFAAMNILEPLYFQCLVRMRAFIDDEDRVNATSQKIFNNNFQTFRDELAKIHTPQHPNEEYFIYKTIILRNLYGVDIMKEAVEIAKLRLFLKLVATVEADYTKPNLGLEPLPDIDFNIRPGNTLVGFAGEYELDKALTETIEGLKAKPKIIEQMELVSVAFNRFKDDQVTIKNYQTVKQDKEELLGRLRVLNNELNSLLHKQTPKVKFADWLDDHKPFHWFAEFYDIVKTKGGFDVIIGNPPYTEIPKELNRGYLSHYKTALPKWSRDENLYTLVIERSLRLNSKSGVFGMIVPLSITFSTKTPFMALRKHIRSINAKWWWSHFDRIPSSLFGNNVRTRCTILLKGSVEKPKTAPNFTTSLQRWESSFRDHLLETLQYSPLDIDYSRNFPKVNSVIQARTLTKLLALNRPLDADLTTSLAFSKLKDIAPEFPQPAVYVGGTAYNWFPAWREIPETTTETGDPSLPARTAGFLFSNVKEADVVFALLCSSLGYWWWAVASDGFNLKKWLITTFPVSLSHFSEQGLTELAEIGKSLRISLRKQYVYKDNKGRIGNFYLPGCKEITEKIDKCLSNHLPDISTDFFEDIRNFNNSFSRATLTEEDQDDDDA
jgi:hypothetical protein